MTTRILISIESGKIRACANGNAQVYIEDMNNLNGIEQIQVSEIPNADFDALLAGREIQGEPKEYSYPTESEYYRKVIKFLDKNGWTKENLKHALEMSYFTKQDSSEPNINEDDPRQDR